MYEGMIHGGWMWFVSFLSVLLTVVLLIVLVLGAVWLYRQVRRGGSGEAGPGRDPMQILKTRYAEGEISEEEYRRMKQEIS